MVFSRRLTRAREDDDGGAPRATSRRRRIQPEPPREFVPATEEAIRFIAAVQREFVEFAGEPDKYEEFLVVLTQFKRGSVRVPEVVERMEVILQGHPYVIRGFNNYLPGGFVLRDLQRTF
ncbi:unnamed protein product [Urochloa decumbens]|uniref:Uncharacterized protein n=1 Tax=Urochloa decumbens TaxID=240449 RepID=A0ABC9BE94_9POAL